MNDYSLFGIAEAAILGLIIGIIMAAVLIGAAVGSVVVGIGWLIWYLVTQ